MIEENKIVKGVWIPIEIWENEELNWTEKILLIQIDSYTSKDKSCFFSNEYISKLLKISVTQASRTVSSLMKKGYIEQTKFDGRKRYIRSCININVKADNTNNNKADCTPMSRQTIHECQGSIELNVNHTNITNNKVNNKKELKENEFSSDCLKDYWNNTCKSFAKCHRINADSYNKLLSQMKKNSITTDDLKKAMMILESLDIDNHFKGGNDRGWKASITWLMQNTKGCIVRLLDGEMSYSRTEKENYKRIIGSNDLSVDKDYVPRVGTILMQDEDGVYRTHEKPNRDTIYDGYTNDNRPSMTLIRFLSDTYFWNVSTKMWYKQEKD